MTKSAFISIVGKPNVGKSSLMNNLLGQKVAIVTDKPQTTRTKIMGVLTDKQNQFVFIDTPGLHKPKTKLGESMVKAVKDSMADVDVCVLVIDAVAEPIEKLPTAADKDLIAKIKSDKMPAILAINKIDLVADKSKLMAIILLYSKLYDFSAIIPLSAKKGDGVDILKKELEKFCVQAPHFFSEDELTDQNERTIAAEMIREKMLLNLNKEVPHGIAVSIEKFKDRTTSKGEDIIDIEAIIYCESESHKGIVIGKQGAMLKRISTGARKEIEKFFCCKVNLQCWIKVKEDWRNRAGLIHNFGLD